MMMVKAFLSSNSSSSIRWVPCGSREAVGSSSRMTSGDGRDRTRDAEALLLPARERHRAGAEPVLHLVPQRRLPQRVLHHRVQLRPGQRPVYPEAGRDVVVDGHRGERRGPLEDHPDPPPELHGVHPGRVDVLPVQQHPPGDPPALHQLVHPVQGPEEGGLPASRRPDQGVNPVGLEAERHALHGGELAVHRGQLVGLDPHPRGGRGRGGWRRRRGTERGVSH